MALYGYARVSAIDQDLSIQQAALKAAGCEIIRAEKITGTKREGRAELETLMEFMRSGDTLCVTRIDRLARDVRDLQNLVHELQAKGVTLKATEQSIDTGSAAGKAFLGMLGVFAEFETNIRSERQLEGIAKAKAAGVYKGRVPTARRQSAQVLQLRSQGMAASKIAAEMGIGRASVYRILSAADGLADAAD